MDYRKITVHSKKFSCSQSAAHKKQSVTQSKKFDIDGKRFSGMQNISPDNIFPFKTLHTTPRRHVSLTQAVILSSTSNFFTTIAVICNNMWPQVKNYRLHFSLPSLFLTDPSGNTCFLQWVQKVMSVGCNLNWLISLHIVYFILWLKNWQLTFSKCIVIFL